MSDLRRQLAKDQKETLDLQYKLAAEVIKAKCEKPYPWPAEAWEAARNGTVKPLPPMRFPVSLTPDGPISSPEELQKLAGTKSFVSEAIATTQVTTHRQEIGKATICVVDFEGRARILRKADISGSLEENLLVMYDEKVLFAMVVERLKEGHTLDDEDTEEEVDETEDWDDVWEEEHEKEWYEYQKKMSSENKENKEGEKEEDVHEHEHEPKDEEEKETVNMRD